MGTPSGNSKWLSPVQWGKAKAALACTLIPHSDFQESERYWTAHPERAWDITKQFWQCGNAIFCGETCKIIELMAKLFKSQDLLHPSVCNPLFCHVTIRFRKIKTVYLSWVFDAVLALFFWFKSLWMVLLWAVNLVISLTSLHFTHANYSVEYKQCVFSFRKKKYDYDYLWLKEIFETDVEYWKITSWKDGVHFSFNLQLCF